MKQGKTLVELAQELVRQQETKKDFLAPAKQLLMQEDRTIKLLDTDLAPMPLNEIAHGQLAQYLDIPKAYYDKMREQGNGLFAKNVNHWLQKSEDKRTIRALDNTVRAFLSDRYKMLDYSDTFEAVYPVIKEMNLEILSCDVTERKLYIKAVDKNIMRDVPTGKKLGDGHTFFDTCCPAVEVSTSEVGFGALKIQAGWLTSMCTNLAWFMDNRTMRKYHVGARHELADGHYELLSDSTKQATMEALWKQAADVMRSAFDVQRFDQHIDKLKGLTEQKIEGKIDKVVEITAKRFDIRDSEKESILKHLIEGADLTRYGLLNAITRAAEDLESYDRATEFEKIGGQVIELSQADWKTIQTAA